MYSIVLMAAVTAGPDTTAFGRGGCHGCSGGCYGGGCYGGGYGGCYGGGYGGGCYGGGYGGGSCHGGRGGGGLFHRNACHGGGGCSGSCYGGGYGGCYGGGYGGGYGGCYGGYSGCFGGVYYGSSLGCCGGGFGGCYGGGYGGCYGGVYGGYSMPYGMPMQTPIVVPMQTPIQTPTPKQGEGASLKFQLPADARLFVDGQRTGTTGAERAFVTPALTPGQKYYYDVKAELDVGGKTVTEEKRVIVEAGANVVESFPKLTAAAAQPAGVAGK